MPGLTVDVSARCRMCTLVSQSENQLHVSQYTYYGLAKRRRKSVMKSVRNVIAASNGA